MYVYKPRLHELKILERLRRANKDAPEEVLAAEARHRFEAKAFSEHKGGTPQVVLAKRFGYSVANASRIIAAGRRAAEERIVSPLTVWQGRRIEQTLADVRAAYDAEHAPAPEPEAAFTPEQDAWWTKSQVAALGAIGFTSAGNPRIWHLILDGNDLTLVDATVPPVPESAPPTDADRYMFALVKDRGMLLSSAVRMLQLAAGIEATGAVDDETLSLVAGLAAWQSRTRPLMEAGS